MQSIDILRIGTISFSGARSAPGERSGDRSECHASSQKQTTVKILCIADSPNVEADSESGKRPADGFLMPTLPRRLLASLGCLSSDHARLNRRRNLCDTVRGKTPVSLPLISKLQCLAASTVCLALRTPSRRVFCSSRRTRRSAERGFIGLL